MKIHILRVALTLVSAATLASAQTPGYTNFIRQIQTSTGVQCDVTVAARGVQGAILPVGSEGSRFELWTITNPPLVSYLLDTKYVGAFIPVAVVTIHSEDPYGPVLRTRADRPFSVDISVSGLHNALKDPAPTKYVNVLRYVQSYGTNGTGVNLDYSHATLLTQASITQDGSQTLSYALTSIPGANLSKVCGEERFSVFSLAERQTSVAQIASSSIQIWPVADGALAGLSQGQLIRLAMPQVTVTLNDLYPSSTTYVQVYHGNPQLGVTGKTVPGSILVLNETVPQCRVLTLKGYDAVLDSEGLWTMELLTLTPFGIDRLAYVSFNLNRMIKINSNLTTIE